MPGRGPLTRPSPVLAGNLFRQDATKLARAADQIPAHKFANQLFYGTPVSEAGPYYGYGEMGWAGQEQGHAAQIHYKRWNCPVWEVSADTPRVPVWLVKSEPAVGGELAPEEELRTDQPENQARLMSVPLPASELVKAGLLRSNGTDGHCYFYCPETGECWGFHRLTQFLSGPHKGEWKANAGHYHAEVGAWSGAEIGAVEAVGQSTASKLCCGAGVITMQDLVRVLRGGKIGHALSISAMVTQNAHVAPATLHDTTPKKNPQEFLPDGTTKNPAYWTKGPEFPGQPESEWSVGWFDGVPEGSWVAYPAASRASDYPALKTRIQIEIYEALREYGGVPTVQGGSCGIWFDDPKVLGTDVPGKYASAKVNPYNGSPAFQKYINEVTTEAQRSALADPTLPVLWEGSEVDGPEGILAPMPWRTLELLEPREG
jgi:hypothetical protein